MRTCLILAMLIAAAPSPARTPTSRPPALSSFRDDADLRAFLRRIASDNARQSADAPPPPVVSAPPPPPAPVAAMESANQVVVTAARAPDAITNTQVAGVDEGGIVKQRGDILVILRRGRLFTVSLAGGDMRPVAAIDAFPPGVDGSGDWYDEMLLAGDRVVVIGYSYARGGTQVNRFRLGADGSLRFEDATALRSNDYYSSRNYASRLIGTRLVYYSPLSIDVSARDPLANLPAIRRWQPGKNGGAWRRVVAAQRVFVPGRFLTAKGLNLDTAHSVTTCDLAAATLECSATAVLGSGSRSFFVSANAVYVWTTDVWPHERAKPGNGFLYRLPFDPAAPPQAVGVRGVPVDQFSFNPDAKRSTLDVVVQADGGGDTMWRPEVARGALALVRIPTALFGGGAREVPLRLYQPLPAPGGWSIQNRFVGDHLLYGTGQAERVQVVALGDGRITPVSVPHGTGRLDLMGADAIVVGEGKAGLGFSTIVLDATPRRAGTFILPAAREGESRSQAFFYRPDTPDGASGLLGLPIARARLEGMRFLGNSSAIQFLRRADRHLADAGELAARGVAGEARDDRCVASCVDWYGNARPIFTRGRVFALMGYELVEGREAGAGVREVARVDFAPRRGR